MWFSRKKQNPQRQLRELRRVLPEPEAHLSQYAGHECYADGNSWKKCQYGCSTCPTDRAYPNETVSGWAQRVWNSLNEYNTARKELNSPVEMQLQWILLLAQGVNIAEAIREHNRIAEIVSQYQTDRETLGEAAERQLLESMAVLEKVEGRISEAIASIDVAAVTASAALAAKRKAEERAEALRRLAHGSDFENEAAARAAHLAEVICSNVTTLERFTAELESSIQHLELHAGR